MQSIVLINAKMRHNSISVRALINEYFSKIKWIYSYKNPLA